MTTGEASAHLPRAIPLNGSPSQAGKQVTTPGPRAVLDRAVECTLCTDFMSQLAHTLTGFLKYYQLNFLFWNLGLKTKPVGEEAHYLLTDWRFSRGAVMYYLNWSMLSFCWPGFPSQRHDTTERWWDLTVGSTSDGRQPENRAVRGRGGCALSYHPQPLQSTPQGKGRREHLGGATHPHPPPLPSPPAWELTTSLLRASGPHHLWPQAQWSVCCGLWAEDSTQLWAFSPGLFLCSPPAWMFNQSDNIY